MRLLIVEDNALDAELTVRQLEAEGIDCSWTRVATEPAFRNALESAPDLIISDCALPGFDGVSAFSIAASEAPAIPFVFVSGTLDEALARDAIRAGAAGYIAKGDRAHLARTVKSVLEKRALRGRRSADRADRAHREEGIYDDAATGAAQHLMARRSVLDAALRQAPSARATVLLRSPPIPAALLMIEAGQARDRFVRLLSMANLETDVPTNAGDALEQLATRVHALLFTDSLELIRGARQLPSGVATHIVFVGPRSELRESEALRAGANDCMPSDARGEHFWAHLTIARRIADLAASLQLALKDNCMLSTIDELTRAGRRGFFEEHFPREVERALRLRRPLALVMCDIDYFKRVNDRYGHQAGDEVLKEFTARISASLRLGKDWIARLGGEEFAIVFPDTATAEACVVAARLRERIRANPFEVRSNQISITASFGVCALDASPRGLRGLAERMVGEADAALYQSKHDGRDRVTGRDVSSDEPRANLA
jgi:two-component system cell cycle response regulator